MEYELGFFPRSTLAHKKRLKDVENTNAPETSKPGVIGL
jgi:hypothetical protein